MFTKTENVIFREHNITDSSRRSAFIEKETSLAATEKQLLSRCRGVKLNKKEKENKGRHKLQPFQ
jgi:hypothetical protein